MTIDETIKSCDEVVTANKRSIDYHKIQGDTEWIDENEEDCIECAEANRQFAEWLKELKELRDFANFVAESVMEEDFEEDSGVYAEIFCRKLYKIGYMKSIDGKWIFNDEEVNADEDNN